MSKQDNSGKSTTVTKTTTTVVETRVETPISEERPQREEKSFEREVLERVALAFITGGLLS